MLRSYRFKQVDVFAERPFEGNPLAVFPEADGLSEREMLQLARELNLSETTFVFTPEKPGDPFRVRIFTPGGELPFAGHPVIGTHWVLADLGMTPLTEPITTAHLSLGVGILPAELEVRQGRVDRVTMTQGRPEFLATLDDTSRLASALGLDAAAMEAPGAPVQLVSTGIPQLMAPVRSLEEISSIDPRRVDLAALSDILEEMGTHCVLLFCLETQREDTAVHVRLLAPGLGVPEDPATGSANGALGAYLVKHGILPRGDSPVRFCSEQGSEIGRPSLLEVEVFHGGGVPTKVRVSGRVVPIAEGVFTF